MIAINPDHFVAGNIRIVEYGQYLGRIVGVGCIALCPANLGWEQIARIQIPGRQGRRCRSGCRTQMIWQCRTFTGGIGAGGIPDEPVIDRSIDITTAIAESGELIRMAGG